VAEDLPGGASAQPVGIADPLPAGQGGVNQGHRLGANAGRAGRVAEIDVGVEQRAQPQTFGQAGSKDQPASATAWWSSKLTAIASGLWETRIEQVPS
jgi:hypothetical protein